MPTPRGLTRLFAGLGVLLLAAAGAIFAARGAAQDVPRLVVMISVDGLRPDYVLAADRYRASIPNLRRFVKEGAFAQGVEGVVPTVTYPSHTTLITGVWPARHGILSNLTFDPLRDNQQGWYWYTEDIRVPTLWDAARAAGLATASIQWPVSVGAPVTWNIPEFWRAGTADDGKLLRAVSTPGLLAQLEPDLGAYPRRLEVEDDERRARYALRILETRRPALTTLHLIALDHTQHETGPGSAEVLAVLERLDALIGALREAAERLAPGRATVAIVSDHGFAPSDRQLDLFPAFRAAGLLTTDGRRVTDWRAMPWTAGGSAAVVLKDPADAGTRGEVRTLLERLSADPANGIDRVLEGDALHRRGGFPDAAFLVSLKPGWRMGSGLTGSVLSRVKAGGVHGQLPDVPELRAAFFLVGPGVPAGRDLGLVDMRDIAPTVARRLDVALPSADGRDLLAPAR